MKNANPTIYRYLDYRLYLRDLYHHRKTTSGKFSFRFFSKEAGFASPNYLKMVMDGERNLSQASIIKFIDGLKLERDEAEFFENLVYYTQAETLKEKNHYYEKMASSKHYLETNKLEKQSFDFFNQWYNLVIREMLSLKQFRPDPTWIACNLNPRITVNEAQRALDTLLALGFIEGDSRGMKKLKGNLATDREVYGQGVANIHKALIQKGLEAIDRVPANKRDIGSLTVAIKEEKIPAIKEMIQNFRHQLHSLLQDDKDAEVVYQIQLLAFPLTTGAAPSKTIGKKDAE